MNRLVDLNLKRVVVRVEDRSHCIDSEVAEYGLIWFQTRSQVEFRKACWPVSELIHALPEFDGCTLPTQAPGAG